MRKIEYIDHECLECKQFCKNRRSLGNHLNKTHKTSVEAYTLKHFFNGVLPKCMCGCGQSVKWKATLYYYADYVNGHNPAGFRVSQPTFTREQISKRNAAIKHAYDKKPEIKKSIGIAVQKTLSDPSVKKKISEAQLITWSNPAYKQRMKDIRKQVWDEQYDQLCEKIFTDEFRKKISLSNMKRDLKHTSIEQVEFMRQIKSVFADADDGGKWINDVDGTACYDGFIPSKNLLLEWDGTYYHGLDRNEEFTLTQLTHIANDYRKNRMALRAGYSLMRFSGETDVSMLKSFDDMVSHCRYYVTSDGISHVNKMFKFTDDKHSIMSREQLIRTNETVLFKDAFGREFTETRVLPVIMTFFQEYVKAYGWFYPESDEDINDVLIKIRRHVFNKDDNNISSLTNVGSSYLKALFKSYWNVSGGPREAFNSEQKLTAVLKYRLGLNQSKPYHYVLSDGQAVTCKETFDINIANVRRGFVVQRNAVSWFKPSAAFEIYRRFLGDVKAPRVWDPSCGFGARMLGFFAAASDGTYIGTDPAKQTFNDLCSLREELLKHVEGSIHLHNTGSECIALEDGSLDLVFTSPPYFDKEKYFDECGQCWKDYPTRKQWYDNYLLPTFKTAFCALKRSRYAVFNVDKENVEDVEIAANAVGFIKQKPLGLRIGADHFKKKNASDDLKCASVEPILVFLKP